MFRVLGFRVLACFGLGLGEQVARMILFGGLMHFRFTEFGSTQNFISRGLKLRLFALSLGSEGFECFVLLGCSDVTLAWPVLGLVYWRAASSRKCIHVCVCLIFGNLDLGCVSGFEV